MSAERQVIDKDTPEHIILLRRIAKLLESQAVTDSALRQKVTMEGVLATTGVNQLQVQIGSNSFGSGSMHVGHAGVLFGPANLANSGTPNGFLDCRFMLMDVARAAFAQGVRANLEFT